MAHRAPRRSLPDQPTNAQPNFVPQQQPEHAASALRRLTAQPQHIAPAQILQLQRILGNRAVRRALAPASSTPNIGIIQPKHGQLPTTKEFQSDTYVSLTARRKGYIAKMDEDLGLIDTYSKRNDYTPEGMVKFVRTLLQHIDAWLESKKGKEQSSVRMTKILELQKTALSEYADLHTTINKEDSNRRDNVKQKHATYFEDVEAIHDVQSVDDLFLAPLDRKRSPQPQKADIKQGNIGDCYLLAALLSLVDHDPGHLKSMFKISKPAIIKKVEEKQSGFNFSEEDADMVSVEEPAIADVSLYRETGHGQYQQETYSVPVGAHNNGIKNSFKLPPWPMVIELAYAMRKGSHKLISGGQAREAFIVLLGPKNKQAKRKDLAEKGMFREGANFELIAKRLKAGYYITVGTKTSKNGDKDTVKLSDGTDLPMQHAYSVASVDGEKLVIDNPHGQQHKVTKAELSKYFSSADYAKVNQKTNN